MEFKSQIATTIEQSKRLLKLGLKPETADMFIDTYFPEEPQANVGGDITIQTEMVPAWSLHRLIELYKDVEDTSMWSLENVNYDNLIQCIRLAIKHDTFNKEYLCEQ